MPNLERPGAEIYYEVWGERGPWILLLNGYTRSLTDFRLMGKRLSQLPARILAMDNRAAGRSRAFAPFTFAQMGGDARAVLEDAGAERAHVLGISMGGTIAQQLAGEHPDRVDRLMLVSTAPGFEYVRNEEEPWSADPVAIRRKLSVYFTDRFLEKNRLLVDAMVKQIARAAAEGDFVERARAQRQSMQGAVVSNWTRRIRARTRIVHGDQDRVVPPQAARDLQAMIPGAELKWIPEAGHLLLAEAPRQLEAEAVEFFTGH